MNGDPIDAGAMLQVANSVQAAVEAAFSTEEREAARQPAGDDAPRVAYANDERERALDDFALDGALESLELLAAEIGALVEQKEDQLYAQALEIYYATEELVRDPKHADLVPLLETMRIAHIEQYGREVPPRSA